jgi:hypothetical protein
MLDKINKLIYLAIPYTWNPEKSFEIANKVAAKLMLKGIRVFSPISHSYPIAKNLSPEQNTSYNFWMHQDLTILSRCDELLVVTIGDNGESLIKESKGCTTELQVADALGIPINYMKYDL